MPMAIIATGTGEELYIWTKIRAAAPVIINSIAFCETIIFENLIMVLKSPIMFDENKGLTQFVFSKFSNYIELLKLYWAKFKV